MRRVALLVVVLLSGWILVGQDDTPQALVKFMVLRDGNGKPVRNAGVVLHSVNEKGKQAKGGLELKTDGDGRTSFDGIPYGKLRVQVLATGFQTFGQDYEVNQPQMEITIKLKKPQSQYSIYGNQEGADTPPQPKQPQ
jgi:hypothetical protein